MRSWWRGWRWLSPRCSTLTIGAKRARHQRTQRREARLDGPTFASEILDCFVISRLASSWNVGISTHFRAHTHMGLRPVRCNPSKETMKLIASDPSKVTGKPVPRLVALLVAAFLAAALLATVPTPAAAADSLYPPPTPLFDRVIDGYLTDGSRSGGCPAGVAAQPGVVAFRDLIRALYPSTRDYGIVACQSGTSDHNEGRAWDWGVEAGNAYEKAVADRALAWLLAGDDWGNQHAMLRRLGIKYIIWNRQIWSTSTKAWRAYSCDGTASGCHTNHVHFSFAWPGARQQTTWWTAHRLDGPAAASTGTRTDVLMRGLDGAIWQNYTLNDGASWNGWFPLGGFSASAPAAVWWSGQLHVFVRGPDNQLYHKFWTSSQGWSGWVSRGGLITSAPAAAAYGGQLQVLARGGDGALWQLFLDGAGWHGWFSLAGGFLSGSGATEFTDDVDRKFFVSGRGLDSAVWQRFYQPSTNQWTSWYSLGGATYSDPDMARFQNRIQVVVRGTDGTIFHRSYRYDPALGEFDWEPTWRQAGSSTVASAPGISATSSYLHLFARGSNGQVLWRTYTGSTWSGFLSLGGGTV